MSGFDAFNDLIPLSEVSSSLPSGGDAAPRRPDLRPMKDGAVQRPHDESGGKRPLFDACVQGVQLRFKHLDPLDIHHPPHCWFDAALARQIAVHLLCRNFGVPKRAVAGDIMKSRAAVNRALESVDERMGNPHFAASYEAMRRHAVLAAKRRKARLER